MLADEHSMTEGQGGLCGICEAERRRVRAECVIRNDRLRDEIGTRRLDARIHAPAKVAVRPAIESAVAYRCHVVGDEIAAQLIPLIDGSPQHSGYRFPGHAHWIAQP